MQERTKMERVTELARESGAVRPRDLDVHGIPRVYLSRLCERGIMLRRARGVYMLADADWTESHSLVEVSKRVPQGIICLLSALAFHGMTTENSHEVWMAIERSAHRPRLESPPLRIVRFSGAALYEGIETHRIEGVTVQVYSPAKTVADCFKYRNKIGLDVALAALRDFRRYRRGTSDELWRCARVCRMTNIMRPYMEAIL